MEINKESNSNGNHFNIHVNETSRFGNSLSADPTDDTNGLQDVFNHANDSIRKANGWQ